MKVAAYIRVSTDEQAQEGYSIPAQRNRLEAYAISQGWEIVHYYVDEGLSAKDLERPELQRMIEGVKEGIFDVVLVYRLDRLTRSVLDLYQLLDMFDKYNCKFKSATEIYDTTTAIGRLFITLVAALAQWERENLGERVRMGMLQKAQEGKWTVSLPPFGYKSIDTGNELDIEPQEALIVKEIFSLYLKGKGMLKIARELNERGIKTRKNKTWSNNTISYILTNPVYIGNLRYNYRVNSENYFEIEGVVPLIITEKDFNQVQLIIKQRSNSHPREATSRYIFSKVLKCARCGKTLTGKNAQTSRGDKKYISYNYTCRGNQEGTCDLPGINENYLEVKFVEILNNWDVSKQAEELSKEENNQQEIDHTDTIRKLEQELKEIESRRSKWQYAWVNEMINDIDFQKRMKEETEKEKMILQELENLKPKESPSTTIPVFPIWIELQQSWNVMPKEKKKQFIQLAVQSIEVDRTKGIKGPTAITISKVKFN
jgi:site-specific DNA recombinase